MGYPIEEIEGIGDVYGTKLEANGIKTTDDLLKACATPTGRAKIAEDCGISGKLVLTWSNMADLMRINGIGKQFSELLEAAGVDTVKELRHRNAANLAAKMAEVNAEKKLAKASPSESQCTEWIEQAKQLDAVLEY